jgi:site-specific DNA-methyltransferase (adenine-specific)
VRVQYKPATIKNNGKPRSPTKGRFGSSAKTFYVANENGALPRDVLEVPALSGGAGSVERAHWCHTCQKFVFGKEMKMHENCKLESHPTQKPQKLTRKLIKAAIDKSENDNFVVVPFSGSGSEVVVAAELGCSVVGFEINETYQKIANAWVERSLKAVNDNIKSD